jgi:hypothetical protein
VATAGFLSVAATVSAAHFTYSGSFAWPNPRTDGPAPFFGITDWTPADYTDTTTINKFPVTNPPYTLTGVLFTLSVRLEGDWRVENLDAGQSFNTDTWVAGTVTGSLRTGGGTLIESASRYLQTSSENRFLATYDGVDNFDGTSGYTRANQVATGSTSIFIRDSSKLNLFKGDTGWHRRRWRERRGPGRHTANAR